MLFLVACMFAMPLGLQAQTACGVWARLNVPEPKTATVSTFADLAAISNNDAWAVGMYRTKNGDHPLAMHWTGSSWKIIATPDPKAAPWRRSFNTLGAVAARSSSDVWAAGEQTLKDAQGYFGQEAFVIHWDGKTWKNVKMPVLPGLSTTAIYDVDISGGSIWFCGVSVALPLIWELRGKKLIQHQPPIFHGRGSHEYKMRAIEARTNSDVWVVGAWTRNGGLGAPYIYHFDGASWRRVTAPLGSSPRFKYFFSDIHARAANDVWIIGSEWDLQKRISAPLLLHFDGTKISRAAYDGGYASSLASTPAGELVVAGLNITRLSGKRMQRDDDLDRYGIGFNIQAMSLQGTCGGLAVGVLPRRGGGVRAMALRLRSTGVSEPMPACQYAAPKDSLRASRPAIGRVMHVDVGDPGGLVGLRPGKTISVLLLSAKLPARMPCGTPIAGAGIRGGFGELMLDLSAPLISPARVWLGRNRATRFTLAIPRSPTLVGLHLYIQAILHDPGVRRFPVLTEARALGIGH